MDAVDLSRSKHILDVGGNIGVFVGTILQKQAHLKGTVFDLPQVVPNTRKRAASVGLGDRLDAVGGDFMKDPWPSGPDVITFIRMNNSRPREELLHLLKKAYALLPSGGKVIFFEENVLDGNPNNVPHLAIWAQVLFFMGSRGEVRRVDEWEALFKEAGLVDVQSKLGKPWGAVWGTKP
jgi:demethylspheroidene O-methyltransferase